MPEDTLPAPARADQIRVVQPYYKIVRGIPAAMVRSYKEPLYDSVLILAAAPSAERVWFQRPIGQTLEDNATAKTELHTNLTQSGVLGSPSSFDLYGFNARVAKGVAFADYNAIMSAGLVSVFFGQNQPFLRVPLEEIPAGVDTEGLSTVDSPHVGLGVVDNYYRFDIGGQALHIHATESFRATLTFPSGIGTVETNTLARFYMRGIRYKGV